MREDYYGTSGDFGGGVGHRTTHFFSQNNKLLETGKIGCFKHHSMIIQHPPWVY